MVRAPYVHPDFGRKRLGDKQLSGVQFLKPFALFRIEVAQAALARCSTVSRALASQRR